MFEEKGLDKYSIRVVSEGKEYMAYVEEMPTIRVYADNPIKSVGKMCDVIAK